MGSVYLDCHSSSRRLSVGFAGAKSVLGEFILCCEIRRTIRDLDWGPSTKPLNGSHHSRQLLVLSPAVLILRANLRCYSTAEELASEVVVRHNSTRAEWLLKIQIVVAPIMRLLAFPNPTALPHYIFRHEWKYCRCHV